MYLTKINIKNFRLILDASIDFDKELTLIVGKNNSGKTSCMHFIKKIFNEEKFCYDDYPVTKRKRLFDLVISYFQGKLTFEELQEKFEEPSIRFYVDYSEEPEEKSLGALSSFIIDIDSEINSAEIEATYKFDILEDSFRTCFEKYYNEKDSDYRYLKAEWRRFFSRCFSLRVYAINPKYQIYKQSVSIKELKELFPFYAITAERILGENAEESLQDKNAINRLVNSYFCADVNALDEGIREDLVELREKINKANIEIQNESSKALSKVISKSVGFGYPNSEQLKLGVKTEINIDNSITSRAELTYNLGDVGESLPATHNGLGYKNLINIEIALYEFSKRLEIEKSRNIPLLFIEEPESHMHPQMQRLFAEYVGTFVSKLSKFEIQIIITTHSPHIANTVNFAQIRYVKKQVKKQGNTVIFKNLKTFVEQENKHNLDFIRKYLTISRCDLFFADKVILIEGTSERLLIPDMVEKCFTKGLFGSSEYSLNSQYYSLIEVGGAYAYKFIPFIDFLGVPCLILTDIDSVDTKNKRCLVSNGVKSSNATINNWINFVKMKGGGSVTNLGEIINLSKKKEITLDEISNLSDDLKTINKIHIEYQVKEANGFCGRSLEESIINVNPFKHDDGERITKEEDLAFSGNKTDFALNLIMNYSNYTVPKYIQDGLVWLNETEN